MSAGSHVFGKVEFAAVGGGRVLYRRVTKGSEMLEGMLLCR